MQRNMTIDVARGFTVFIMPAVHSMVTYSTPVVQHSLLGQILGFLAEGPGAELFMLLMGLCISYGRKKSKKQILARSFKLLCLAYFLNFIKIILPLYWDGIPVNVFTENYIPNNLSGWLLLIFMGDILQLAAIAYLVCGLLYQVRQFARLSIMLAAVVIIMSPLAWHVHSCNILPAAILDLFVGTPPRCFFPVFPWLAYPLIGVAMGHYIKTTKANLFYRILFCFSTIFILLGGLVAPLEPDIWEESFYRMGPGGTLKHLGIALGWYCLCFLLVNYIRANYVFRFLSWLSKNITLVYCLQWVVIFWLTPWFSYHHLGMKSTLISIFLTSSLTFLLTFLIPKIYSKVNKHLIFITKFNT